MRPARPSRRPTEASVCRAAAAILRGTRPTCAPRQHPSPNDASGAPVSELDAKVEKATESMEDIRPEMNGELMSLNMKSALFEGKPYLQIEKTFTPATEGAQENKEEEKDEDADDE